MSTKFTFTTIKFLVILLLGFVLNVNAQTTVFNDAFSTSAGSTYTISSGAIGTSTTWSLSRSGFDFGAGINSGLLLLNNDASTAGNSNGWGLASTSTTAFTAPYSSTLNANSGLVTWSFNMRQQQSNPSGFASGNYGVAFILAGTAGTTNSSGTGYAVVLGNSGKTDPLKLVAYTAGLQNNTQILASNTSALTDFGNTNLSVKVTYAASTNTWQLFVRNDGAAFIDPSSGSLTLQGSNTNSAYTSTVLPLMGGFWSASTRANQVAMFDNVKVSVVVPTLVAIAPPSKVAGSGGFTITVTGTGFVSGTSVVRWNGSSRATTFVSSTQLTASVLAADLSTAGTALITVANGTGVSNAQTFTIDAAGVANIALSTSALNTMTTVSGTASVSQSYTVSGTNLTNDVVVSAPANFEVSTNNSTFFGALNLTRSGAVLTGQPVTVYTRVKAAAPAGLYAATIDHSAWGGATKLVTVSATVMATKPTTAATAVSFTAVTSTTFTVNLTRGNGANRLVLIRAGSAVNAAPTDGVSYAAFDYFGGGSEVGTGNFAVYAGSSNTVNVTGLLPNTTYYVAVFEYNGSAGTESYLTTTPATANRTTLSAPVGWQIYNSNTPNTISFDTTVDGVNEGAFLGTGMSNTLTVGEINSNAWAVTGFSDGAIAFGGTSIDGSDYDRGTTTAGVSIGGLYAVETATNNFSLGIQPATADFVPGSVTLRFQNQTGAPITSVSIGYKVYVYNDQAASSSFNFSHSADNSSYTNVAGLNVVSPAAADGVPGWKSYYRVVTLTGLNIAANAYYHFRWTGAAVSGSTDFDEFTLDDIVMVANPTTNFATFNGTAENFVVLGNTKLSGATTVTSDLILNGGKVDLNDSTLTLNGTVTNTTLQGLKGSATSNLILSGAVNTQLSFDQTTPGTSNLLNNLTIATTNANTITLTNDAAVNGTLTTSFGQTLNLGTSTFTGNLATIANNGTITTQNTSATPVASGKTWSGTGLFNYNASSAAQTVAGGTYQNLTISTSGGAVAATSFTVNGVLNLPLANPSTTTGSLSTANFTLTMGGSATNTGIGDVTGTVSRNSIVPNVTYTFGNPFTFIVFPNIGTLPTTMSLKVTIGTAPSWRTGAINRTFDFIQNGGSGTKAIIKAHYLDSELNGNAEIKMVDWAHIVSSTTTLEQGRSNYSITDNWIELTNVNVAVYFTNTFGQVLLSLDESDAGVLTWNGSVSSSWTTAGNWTPNATPSDYTIVYIPDAATTPNDPMLNASVLLGTLNIESGGILNAPDNSQITMNNGAGAWINYGTYNPGEGTSTVIFTSPNATMGGSTTFNNLTVNTGCNLRPMSNTVTQIAGQLTINGALLSGAMMNTFIFSGTGQTIPNPNGPSLNAYLNLTINGTGALFPSSLNIMGNFTLNQAVDFTGKTIVLNGMLPQIISGSIAPTFNNLTINNTSGGVTLTTPAAVDGTLTLSSGILTLASTNLTLGASAVAGSFSAANMIICTGSGEVRRNFTSTDAYTFPVGDSIDVVEYSPLTVNVTTGSFSSAYIGVSVIDGLHPNNASISNNLTRYWNVNQSGITGGVATITATYVPSDVTGNEAEVNAGQLNGTFNQASNSWIRYGALASNSFTAAAAPLLNGQTAAFTGIKGGTYSATVSGYGVFCVNDPITLTATLVGGDAPYSYVWSSGLGNLASVTAPSNGVGTLNYTVTVTDSNGFITTDNASVTTLAPAIAGTVSGTANWCYAKRPTDLTVVDFTGNVQKWQYATDAAFSSPIDIASTATVLEQANAQPAIGTLYYRAIIGSSNTCPPVITPGFAVTGGDVTTYTSGGWLPSAPNAYTTSIIFDDNYAPGASVSLRGCDCTVNAGKVVVFPSESLLELQNEIVVNPALGTALRFENNAVLLQVNATAVNNGTVEVKRHSSALMRLDYTMWSSPVIGTQTLKDFSPSTVNTRFYRYNEATNFYSAVDALTTTFGASNIGKGFLIRMPNDHPTTATVWTAGTFTGVPSNGMQSIAISSSGSGFNLVGNPYLSQLNVNQFLTDNGANIESTLYFWRKTNEAVPTTPAQSGYCTYTGGTLTQGSSFTNGTDPLGKIQIGQGFMVKAKAGATNVTFNNGMRVRDTANQFFRAASPEAVNTLWMNLLTSSGGYAQMALSYRDNATLGVDINDGLNIGDGQISFGSWLDTRNFIIQSRPLPFDMADAVPLTFTVNLDGNYTIAIDHVNGFFSNGAQTIYVRDNVLNTVTNLTTANYTFATTAGTFNNRFDIVYQAALSTPTTEFNENSVVVYKNNSDIVVNTGMALLKTVQIYDMRGSLLLDKTNINASEVRLNIGATNQVVLVKATLDEGQVVTKKVIN